MRTHSPAPCVGHPTASPPGLSGPARLGAAFALLLALALAQPASARSYDAGETQPAVALAAATVLDELFGDIPREDLEASEYEIQLAMLEVGPMLYSLAIGEGPAYGPPAWRAYAMMAALFLSAFVLLVSTSAASLERRALRRRSAWRRRAAGFYE
jgi:hypothetical protein